ncbi:sodium/potassium-transporting ATPase subunit beta-2 [Drosophila ficusphila]|uniref:sodium/potassium-transporting ATPase subunit beta-2 n=1 Tax=Drosophila ficusphila TaxID=30025 RepID=UPI0007E84E08|nr:sodium/potassium-transporting ATPase subunit beta-2 [Drosophila ficusphila]
MPEDVMVPAGDYKLVKQFRRENEKRRKKDLPWSKRVFDIDEHKLFGRTAWAWFRITLLYLFLYLLVLLIVLFWIGIFWVAIIDPHEPRWLKGPPGLSVVPANRSTLTWYTHLMNEIYPIADKIDDFLNSLNDNGIDFFGDANQDTMWGYESRKPTVFIKLNKVIGFQPETYDTPDDLPKEAPAGLDDTVRKYGGSPKIWMTCEVTEGPKPELVFLPGPFYEASEKMTGVQRVVAVQLNKMPKNKEVIIGCKVWARNIPIDEKFPGKGHVRISMNMRVETVKKPSAEDVKGSSTTPNSITALIEPEEPNRDRYVALDMPAPPRREPSRNDKPGNKFNKEPLTEPPS